MTVFNSVLYLFDIDIESTISGFVIDYVIYESMMTVSGGSVRKYF